MADGIRVAPLDGAVAIEAEAQGQRVKLRVTKEYAARLAAMLQAASGQRPKTSDILESIVGKDPLADMFGGRRG